MGTMALDRYFPSKNDLMDAAIDAAMPEIELPEPGAAPWKERSRRSGWWRSPPCC
jgi:AcrR family transcriptional regulator